MSKYPVAVDIAKVGKYPALCKSGAGFVWDDVLEYRVWCHPHRAGVPGDDYFESFATHEEAVERAVVLGSIAEIPLVLVLQREHINEPEPGKRVLVKGDRITEWRPEWLEGSKRTPELVEKLLKEAA